MLKLTVQQLKDSLGTFHNLINQRLNGSAKISYNLGKTWKALKVESEHLREAELVVIKQFGGVEKDGIWRIEPGQINETDQKALDAQLADLYGMEIELWGTPLTLEDIDKSEISLTPVQFEQLDWLIIDLTSAGTGTLANEPSALTETS